MTESGVRHIPVLRREIFGWAMFDFANQAYTLLIITVIFGDLFTTVIVGDRGDNHALGNLLWSLSLAISYLLVVLSAPLLGAIMDYSAARKRFLFASYLVTVAATALLYFVEPGWIVLACLLVIVSNYAYSVGESFISSFLPDLGPRETLGRISGLGWAMGYVGGLVAAGFTLAFLGEVSAANYDRIRWVGPFSAAFFLLAAIPTFAWLHERRIGQALPPGSGWFGVGLERLAHTLRHLRGYRDLAFLLVSVFFVMAGIYIIISFAFIYGAQVIGWDDHVRTLMFIVVQITAAVGAVFFGLMQHRIGSLRTYVLTLALWLVAILAIYATPQTSALVNFLFGVETEVQYIFLVAGCLAGLSLGSAQSAGRALVGMLAPAGKAGEFFGFWGVASKLAAVFGLVGLGLLQVLVGLQSAILFCLLLFGAGMAACLGINVERGVRHAGG